MKFIVLPKIHGKAVDPADCRVRAISEGHIIAGDVLVLTQDATPTAADITAAMAAEVISKARTVKLEALGEQLRSLLLGQFNGWTPVQRTMMNGPRLAINDMLLSGDIAGALTAIAGFPLPDASYQPLQATLLTDVQTFAQKAGQVMAATTVEAINAIS